MASMASKGLEGDWQFISEDGYDPAKFTVKNIMADDWMVACMIPKGKMMANMLKRNKEDGLFKLVKFTSNSVESPEENKKLEDQLVSFLEKGISNITKEGKNLLLRNSAGTEIRVNEDDIRQKQAEAQKSKASGGSGRFG